MTTSSTPFKFPTFLSNYKYSPRLRRTPFHDCLGSARLHTKVRFDTQLEPSPESAHKDCGRSPCITLRSPAHRRSCCARCLHISLDHRKSRLHIGPLVVVLQKDLPVPLAEMIHLAPHRPVLQWLDRVRLERNVRHPTQSCHSFQILVAEIRLVGQNLPNTEMRRCTPQKRYEVRRIVCRAFTDKDADDDIRLHAAQHVRLDPLPALRLASILLIEPALEPAGTEPRRIRCKVRLQRPERQTAECYQLLKA